MSLKNRKRRLLLTGGRLNGMTIKRRSYPASLELRINTPVGVRICVYVRDTLKPSLYLASGERETLPNEPPDQGSPHSPVDP